MKKYRFEETKGFAKAISDNWNEYVNHRGFNAQHLASSQMKEHNLVINVYLAPGFKDRIAISLVDNKYKRELFYVSPVDNTEESLRYTIDFILGYIRDVIGIYLRESEN